MTPAPKLRASMKVRRSTLDRLAYVLGLIACAAIPALATDEPVEWRETTRDVYVDGQLDRGVIVLTTRDPNRWGILESRDASEAVVLDRETLELGHVEFGNVTLGESGWVASPLDTVLPIDGDAVKIDESTVLIRLPHRILVIAPHQGKGGSIDRDELFGAVPSWNALYDGYEPNADAVESLRNVAGEIKLTLAFGSWCGDSKREVPRLLRALDAAGNPNVDLEMVSLAGSFTEPGEFIADERLTNVPTLIVSRDGEEIGRVVETPATESLATDLARVLENEPLLHEGRWDREARLASGRYAIRDAAGAERGFEDWELFSREDGGTLLHAFSDIDGAVTEVWHRRDPDGRSSFVEITRTNGDLHSRSRHRIEDGIFSATTRGNGTGIVRQEVRLDARALIVTPSTADAGRVMKGAGLSGTPRSRPAMVLGGSGEAPGGRPGRLDLTLRGAEAITTPAGRFEADHVSSRMDGNQADAWLHAELGIPIRLRRANRGEIVLVEFEKAEDPPL